MERAGLAPALFFCDARDVRGGQTPKRTRDILTFPSDDDAA